MSDPVPQTQPATDNTQKLVNELLDDKAVVEAAIAAYKKDGVKGLAAVLPQVATEVQEDIAAAQAALPEIKAGYKTTEFWLTVSVVAANGVYALLTGKPLPVETNVILGVVTTVYTIVRGLLKKPAATPTAPATT